MKCYALPPDAADSFNLFEIKEMLEAWQERHLAELWEKAYWTAAIINPHLKKPIEPKTLMKPFLPDMVRNEILQEREYFIQKFNLKG